MSSKGANLTIDRGTGNPQVTWYPTTEEAKIALAAFAAEAGREVERAGFWVGGQDGPLAWVTRLGQHHDRVYTDRPDHWPLDWPLLPDRDGESIRLPLTVIGKALYVYFSANYGFYVHVERTAAPPNGLPHGGPFTANEVSLFLAGIRSRELYAKTLSA